MALELKNPLALLAIVPAVLVSVYIYRKYEGKSLNGGILPLVLRLVIISLLVFALMEPVIKIPVDFTEILFVADLSDSTISKQGEMEDFISQSLKLLPENYNGGIVTFGGNALIEQSLGSSKSFYSFNSKPDANYSNIDQALQRAAGLFSQDSRKRIVLLTDGLENAGDAVLRADALGQRGITVDVVYMETAPASEVQLSELTLPSSLYQGENYDIRVEIDSTVETRGVLRLYANRKPAGSRQVQIQKGKNVFIFSETADEAGTIIYEAELDPLTGHDTFRQNNRIASYARIAGTPVIALVEGQDGEGRELAKIMEAGGLGHRVFTPYTLPDKLEELVKYDAIVLANVEYDALGSSKADLIDTYVKSMGRGLLVTGGDNSYALGGWLGTKLEEILPVDMDISKKKNIPSLALAVVIDKSSSMSETQQGVNKMELAKEAAIRSAEALRDEDYMGVVAFDSAAAWVAELQQAVNKEAVQEAIASIQPGGGTNMYPGLSMAYQALQNADTALKHVIVLTDGHTTGGNFESLVSEMAESGITVSAVAVGQDADERLMERIAELGKGRYYFTDDISSIPKIFTKETYMAARSYINNETFHPKALGSSPILSSIDSLPSLDGYITTSLKSGAVPVLVSHKDDDPVLAYWEYGLGRVAAWTSDAKGIWTENWLKWDKAAVFWLNTISSVLPGSSNQYGKIETGREGNMGSISVSLDEADEGFEIHAIIASPNGEESRIKMQPSKPGYYQGNFQLNETGVYLIRLEQQRQNGSRSAMEAGLSYPYSPEYDIRFMPSRNLAEHIAGRTGGRLLEKPEDILTDESRPVWKQHEIWPALLFAALMLFFIDVALRRLGLRFMADKMLMPSVRAVTIAVARFKSWFSAFKPAASAEGHSEKSRLSLRNKPEPEQKADKPVTEKMQQASTDGGIKRKKQEKSPQAKETEDFTSALLEARRRRRIRK